LGFYVSAVDSQAKAEQDNPTIGLLLCNSKNRVVAEYALRDSNKPIGVDQYQLMEALPAELQTSLPSIEQIERELAGSVAAPQRRDVLSRFETPSASQQTTRKQLRRCRKEVAICPQS